MSLFQIGILDKIIYSLLVVFFPVAALSNTFISKLNISDEVFYIILGIWLVCIIILSLYNRYIRRNLVKHGELNININGIAKNIGGIKTYTDYEEISVIYVKDFIRSIFFSSSKYGIKAYLVKLIKKDKIIEEFVISSRSETGKDVDFWDCLKFVKKYRKYKFEVTR